MDPFVSDPLKKHSSLLGSVSVLLSQILSPDPLIVVKFMGVLANLVMDSSEPGESILDYFCGRHSSISLADSAMTFTAALVQLITGYDDILASATLDFLLACFWR
ncbi:unnamed protein product [Protopolystoma xenopodis]|uniref:Uncharacterized protein n=1 Tax=Protopolystoma xenopodis TaxID=117903 RepID=A0A448WX51_9PLAT|nr:unnamed protein product [Protopolystoma xenopodis]